MAIVFKWGFRLLVFGASLAVLALILAYWLGMRSVPDYTGDITVRGLTAPIEIVRNTHNVPHIFGQSDADVYFGLGYAHAQDRLWQMTLMRRGVQGRLSEIFGARTLKTDELLRRLDLYGHASRSVSAQSPEVLAMLEAYARGVNARIRQVQEEALGRGAPEFFIFSPEIAPWQPADSLAVTNLMALQLAGHIQEEVLLSQASLALPSKRVVDLHPDVPGAGIAALPDLASLFAPNAFDKVQFAELNEGDAFLSPVAPRALAGASNAFAADPSRTAAKGSLLANDPHLGLSAPAIWYLARLELETGGVIGGTIPGMPILLVGRSEHIGWGLTSSYMDDQDILMERVNPDNRAQYQTPSGWKEFRTRSSIIQIKDAEPVTLQLRWSDNGPILTQSQFSLGKVTPAGHVPALAWTALSDENTSIATGFELMRARNVEEAIAAGRHFVAPAQNLTVADAQRTAMVVIGRQPKRDANHQSKGRMPTAGWRTENRWRGVMPYDENPLFQSADGGIVGNTNNKMIEAEFPNHISYYWGDTQRINRWRDLMQDRLVHTRDSFIEAQLDTVSFTARALLPLIAKDLWFTGDPAVPGTAAHSRQVALDLLAAWNGEMSEHLPEPLIYATWLRHLQQRLIRDELGPLADEYTHVEPLFIERVFRDVDGAAIWCDVALSAAVESCTHVARASLDSALLWLSERYGPNVSALRWGQAHEARHDHSVLGDIPLLGALVNIRQSTSGGDNTLMRGRTSGVDPDPFANVHGAGYRGVYDFADPDSSVFMISSGQSGHPFSRHYDDLSVLWRRGEYIPMSLDPALARAGGVGVTWLRPE